ncbi:MAG: rane protein of unknown function [Nitrospira sp.]|jgi:hypothetical protein|nr:rane protein of unknown function [Nitrospira sp.]
MFRDKATVVTLLLFVAGYAVLSQTGITSTGHLIDNLVTGYLLAWGLYAFVSALPRKEIRARFVLTTLTGVAIMVVAEILGVTGLVNYQTLLGTPGRTWWDRPGYMRDPDLGYRHVPHYSERGSFLRGNIGEALCLPSNPPTTFDLRYDHNGFRNEEDRDRADVVVIGDSYVESAMLPSSDLLTAILAARLQTPVANLGVTGYGPEQELMVLKRYALDLQPKTIVWVFFEGNDLLQLGADDEDSLQVSSKALSTLDDYWVRSLTRNLLVASRNMARSCIPHRTFLQYRGRFQTADGENPELFFWERPGPLITKDRDRLERLRVILAEAQDLSRKHDIRFVVAFAPASYRVHHGLNNFAPSTPQIQTWSLGNLPQEFERMLQAVSPDIEFIDLTVALREAASTGILTYFPDDTHWTAEGHRVVGETIHRSLFERDSRLAQR